MTKAQAKRRVRSILLYEPSWFAEAMSAVGILAWALGALLTNDVAIRGDEWIMPALGLAVGPIRIAALFMLHAVSRVIGGMVGFVWWGVLLFALIYKFGMIQSIGPVFALLLGDLLTVGKFSFEAHEACREKND